MTGDEHDESCRRVALMGFLQTLTEVFAKFAAEALLGKTEEEARKLVEASCCTLRVMKLNGEELIGTADYVPNRINVAVENGVVTEILGNG